MLSSLKEKILGVSLFNTSEEKPENKAVINLNAGAEILHQFQNQWEELHKNNEDNAKNAEKIANEIEDISNAISASKTNFELIDHIFTNSKLGYNISNCFGTINDVYRTAQNIEKDLIELENLIDEADFRKMKGQHEYNLRQYQLRKEESLESFKATLSENHSKKVTEYEASKQKLLEERQRVFQDAFKTDLELYKNLGTIPEMEPPKRQNGALLEEIQLDFDQKELDQFFEED